MDAVQSRYGFSTVINGLLSARQVNLSVRWQKLIVKADILLFKRFNNLRLGWFAMASFGIVSLRWFEWTLIILNDDPMGAKLGKDVNRFPAKITAISFVHPLM